MDEGVKPAQDESEYSRLGIRCLTIIGTERHAAIQGTFLIATT
jgi:hypothetical protein